MSIDRYQLPANQKGHVDGIVPLRDIDQSMLLKPNELGYEESDGPDFDFWSIVRVLLSYKWMIVAIAVLGVVGAFVMTLRVVPLYQATATIEIQRPEVPIIEGVNFSSNISASQTDMETLYRLLRSRFMAERVAEDLNLANDERYANPNAPRDTRVLQAAQRIVAGLRIAPSGNSRVVNVSYVSPYPAETSRIANGVVESFIQGNLERKYNTTAYAREFLDERLATTKRALEESERRIVDYAEQEGILDLGGGNSLDENSIVALNNELSDAESERIKAEQKFKTASESKAYRDLLDSNALNLLKQRRTELSAEYQELLGRFKPEYPDMVKLQTRIDAVDAEIELESVAIINALEVDFDAAVAREQSLKDRVDQLRLGLQQDRNSRIEYGILQREVETLRTQYQALLQRSKEISIASGIGSSDVSIVDRALVPGMPFEPNMQRRLLQAFILSLAFGVGLAFALNFIDDSIKTPEDVRTKLGLPSIGVIPKLAKKRDLVADELDNPKSQLSEAFASARTALEFATEEGAPSSLLITSTRPGEGKTSTALALAISFAKGEKKVLIIDADMRKPSFVVDSDKSIGLSGLLTGHENLRDHVVQSMTDGLSILPSGVIPPNPAQLLSGGRLRDIISEAERNFDIVIVDSPPVLSFTDSPRLGSVVAGTLLIVEAGKNRTPAARRTCSRLYDARTNLLGVVLSKFDAKKAGGEYSYYYSSYNQRAKGYVEKGSSYDRKRRVLIESLEKNEVDSTQPKQDGDIGDNSGEPKRWTSY